MIRSQARRSIPIAALLALLLARGLTAADSAKAQQLLERGRTLLSDHLLLQAKTSFTTCLSEEPENEMCGYSFAKASLYLAEAYRDEGRTSDAERALDAGIEQLQKTLANKETAEAHSLLADLYGQYIAVHGGLSGMRYGPRIVAENKRALEVDPNNAKAYASLGRQYFNTPPLFGGDVKKAIEAFERSLRIDPTSDETLVCLALAYKKTGNQAGFENSIKSALQRNPDNVLAKQALAGTPSH